MKKWVCLTCHNSDYVESDNFPDALIRFTTVEDGAVAPLCYGCHKAQQKEFFAHEYIHGPIGMEGCSMCHDPHGANNENLLIKEPTHLCVECHESEDMFESPYIHRVVEKDGCLTCHDSHSSDYRYQLLAKTQELCYKCHPTLQKQKDNHPITGHPTYRKKHPVIPDEEFTCISCHSPHASQYENLLQEEDMMLLCLQCHPMDE